MFVQPHSFRFLSLGTLKNSNVFGSDWKWRVTSPTQFLCLSNHSQPTRVLWNCTTLHGQKCSCVYWFRWRTFWTFIVNCDVINSKDIRVIKLGTCTVNMSVVSKISHRSGIYFSFSSPSANGTTSLGGTWPPLFSRLHDHTHLDTPNSVGLLWTSDQPDAETSTRQHKTLTRDRHPCPQRDSKPQSQKANVRRPTP
jgi:hypothetical protein